jgi:hypothetical protein
MLRLPSILSHQNESFGSKKMPRKRNMTDC